MSRLLRAVPAAALLALLAAVLVSPAAASAKTTWLCKPGLAKNPCVTGTALAEVSPAGQVTGTVHPNVAAERKVDCFYV